MGRHAASVLRGTHADAPAGAAVPGAHGAHASPRAAAVMGGHGRHAPCCHCCPATAHSRQLWVHGGQVATHPRARGPCSVALAGHAAHATAPSRSEKVPGGQRWQAGAKVPGGQRTAQACAVVVVALTASSGRERSVARSTPHRPPDASPARDVAPKRNSPPSTGGSPHAASGRVAYPSLVHTQMRGGAGARRAPPPAAAMKTSASSHPPMRPSAHPPTQRLSHTSPVSAVSVSSQAASSSSMSSDSAAGALLS